MSHWNAAKITRRMGLADALRAAPRPEGCRRFGAVVELELDCLFSAGSVPGVVAQRATSRCTVLDLFDELFFDSRTALARA